MRGTTGDMKDCRKKEDSGGRPREHESAGGADGEHGVDELIDGAKDERWEEAAVSWRTSAGRNSTTAWGTNVGRRSPAAARRMSMGRGTHGRRRGRPRGGGREWRCGARMRNWWDFPQCLLEADSDLMCKRHGERSAESEAQRLEVFAVLFFTISGAKAILNRA